MDSHNLEIVDNFLYLETGTNSNTNVSLESQRRKKLISKSCYFGLICRAEACTMTKSEALALKAFERKVLRKINGSLRVGKVK